MDSLFIFFLRRSVPADATQPHAIVCLEYTVIDTLQVLLYSQCHVRRQHSSRSNVIPKADDYHQIDRTAVSCSCFKPDAGMFWNHRKIRTRSSVLVKCRNRDSPTSCSSCICRVDFLHLFHLRRSVSADWEQPYSLCHIGQQDSSRIRHSENLRDSLERSDSSNF